MGELLRRVERVWSTLGYYSRALFSIESVGFSCTCQGPVLPLCWVYVAWGGYMRCSLHVFFFISNWAFLVASGALIKVFLGSSGACQVGWSVEGSSWASWVCDTLASGAVLCSAWEAASQLQGCWECFPSWGTEICARVPLVVCSIASIRICIWLLAYFWRQVSLMSDIFLLSYF